MKWLCWAFFAVALVLQQFSCWVQLGASLGVIAWGPSVMLVLVAEPVLAWVGRDWNDEAVDTAWWAAWRRHPSRARRWTNSWQRTAAASPIWPS